MGTGCAREIAYFLAKKYQKALAFMAGWAKAGETSGKGWTEGVG